LFNPTSNPQSNKLINQITCFIVFILSIQVSIIKVDELQDMGSLFIRKIFMTVIEKNSAEMFVEMRNRYPFSQMEVGDSILLTEPQKAESARVAAIQFSRRNGLTWKFGLRKSREGWRVFRMA